MALDELKARQSVAWGVGEYPPVERLMSSMHADLVERLGPRPGERWLDVGTGAGAIAQLAARAGALVTGLDLSPSMVDLARRLSHDAGLSIQYDVGDVESLPYPDEDFDVVCSCVGVMYAPNHELAAAEMARVCRPEGRIGVTAWPLDSSIGGLYRLSLPFIPAVLPGVGDPMDWGKPEHVQALLGALFDLDLGYGEFVTEYPSSEEAWRTFTGYGPTKALAESLEPTERDTFHQGFVDLFEAFRDGEVIRQPWRYLRALGRKQLRI